MKKPLFLILIFSFLCLANGIADVKRDMANKLYEKYNIPKDYSLKLLNNYTYNKKIIELMNRPAEEKKWGYYKKLFLTEKMIKKGIYFYNKHKNLINEISIKFNVSPEILISILGVESYYGDHRSNIRVLDALGTLAFHYKRRSNYFIGELEHFIYYTYKNKIDPYTIKGSYAGAIGMPQFMPSSIISFGYDYDGNGQVDLDKSLADSLASTANFLKKHGWQDNMPTAILLYVPNKHNESLLLDKSFTVNRLKKLNIKFSLPINKNIKCSVIKTEDKDNKVNYWAIFKNFHVLKKYNPSNNYALVIILLAKKIEKYNEVIK
ncbi:MAG: lytic murein transglycosylase [Deferribacterota bacterium]|nr:lytic murein transglycosylase [Deferribacterota bacterium]